MSYVAFSPKQLEVMRWWLPQKDTAKYDGIICDGAVRSGKTLCMSVSFVSWAMFSFPTRQITFFLVTRTSVCMIPCGHRKVNNVTVF